MKKIFVGIAVVIAMALATSCGCNQTPATTVEEGEVAEVVDSTVVDSTAVAATDSLVVVE